MTDLELAKKYMDDGQIDACWARLEDFLGAEPDHAEGLILAAFCAWKANRFVIGYEFGRRAIAQAAQEPMAWNNMGINAHDLWFFEEAERAFQTAVKLAKDPHVAGMAWMNLSATYIDFGRFDLAESAAREALKCMPYSPKAKANLGFAMLAQHKWDGWEFYSYSLGLTNRQKQKFGEEPDWNGTPGQAVVLYGEQGLGDEISFASMVPDAIRDSKKVILSCDSYLERLFRRSFPQAKVYGTRKAKPEEGRRWDKEDWQFDASCALGELGPIYRRSDESFPKEPYLVADPVRRLMWRSLFDSKRKPVIGIAWSGGVRHSGERFRTIGLEALSGLLKSVDAHWVSLQYKDAETQIAKFLASDESIISHHNSTTVTRGTISKAVQLLLKGAPEIWREILPYLPCEVHEDVARNASSYQGPEAERQLSELRRRLSEEGQVTAGALQALWGEGRDAPLGLRSALERGLALQAVPSRVAQRVDLVQYPYATLTPDYDDTAAMVMELDLVISVQTAMIHLCGAMGKECWLISPTTVQWRYAYPGDRTIWYPSVRIFRQKTLGDWSVPIADVTGRLRKRFGKQVVVAA